MKQNSRRCFPVCYLVVKNFDEVGCLVLQTKPGKSLIHLKRKLAAEIDPKQERLQLITISRPSAYGEYEPYHFVDTEEELMEQAKKKYCS